MKKILLTLVLATSLSFGGFFQEEDKKIHITITTMIGVWGSLIAKKHGATETQAFWIGVGSALAVGLAKEAYDSRDGGTGFDNRDMLANAIGGTLGSGTGIVLFRF